MATGRGLRLPLKNHLYSILGKFGVRDRARAALKALEAGLLRAPGSTP